MSLEPTFAQRELLASREAEQAVIGAALYDVQAAYDAVERLTGEHFSDPVHARIWTRITHLARTGQSAGPYFVRDGLGHDPGFEEWGGVAELQALAEVHDPSTLSQNVATVADRAARRRLRQLARVTESRASDPTCATADELIGELEKGAAEIAQGSGVADAWENLGEGIERALDAAMQRRGRIDYPFGIRELDGMTGGMAAGETTVIGAWTGMGKTLAGLNIARASAASGLGVCVFSLEMSRAPMFLRMACDLAYGQVDAYRGPTIDKALKGDLGAVDLQSLRQARQRADRLPIVFDYRPGLTVAQIEAAVRRQHRRWAAQGIRPGPVIVDHIGKVKPAGTYRGDRTNEMGEVVDDLDAAAKRLGCPMLQLAQLSRKADDLPSADKRPQLSHLKQSSNIEQNARQVILLFRPEYYHREPLEHEDFDAKAERLRKLDAVKGHFYWLVAKQSNGPPGQVLSRCEAGCNAIRDWSEV